MAKLSQKQVAHATSAIVYGGPKSGKTEIVGRLSEHFKLIWVDMEKGHETLFKLPVEWQERIELIDLPDTRSFPIAIETVLKMVRGKVVICEQHGKVGCLVCKKQEKEVVEVNLPETGPDTIVVFDSLTQLSNSAIAHITKKESDDYKLEFDDYGHLSKLLDIFLSHVQQAGYHVVVISHESEIETEGKKKTLVPVGGTRNFSRNVAKYFSHVVYAERKNKKHVFSSNSQYATTILTGSRSDVAVEDYDTPSLLPIFRPDICPAPTPKKVVGKKAEKTEKVGKSPAKSGAAAILARMKDKKSVQPKTKG